MKSALKFLLTLALLPTAANAYQAPKTPRVKYNFNPDWRVKVGDLPDAKTPDFADGDWKRVTTPYAWNEDSAFKVSIDELPTGIAWYRKHFQMPANSRGKKVFLEFEGIRHGGDFYLNGQFIGRSENGIMAFGFDVTPFIKPAPAENVLAARIDNAWNYHEVATGSTFQWNDKNFYANYGGINKNVFLHVTDKLHQTLPLYSSLGTTGVYVYAQNFDIKGKSAQITTESQVKNEYPTAKTFEYEAVVEDMDGKVVGRLSGGKATLAPGETKIVSTNGRLSNLNFWSWGYGYLYNVYTTLKVDGKPLDTVKTRTGFRKTEFSSGALKLNDRTIQVHGYAQRTTNEWPAVGLSVPAWMSDYSNGLMVQSNGNLVRWMHVTPWKQDVESCDRVGLMEAMPAGDSEGDPTRRRWDLRTEVMRDAIIYNRNNPSIVFYESGNKGIRDEHMAEMKAIRDQYDPRGGRAIGSREMLGSKVAEYGGEMLYINKSAGKPLWAMEYSRDEGLRKYWDELSPPFHKNGDGPQHNGQDAFAYNRNQDSHAIEDVVRWYDYWRERPGTGKRVSGGGVNIVFSDSNTHHRGESNYRTSGEVDAMRLPKDGFYANQVMWDGWVNTEHTRAHIIGHWNYAPGTKKDVTVVSSAPKVELFLNGVSKGFGTQSSQFIFTFKNVEWQSSELRAVGFDANGKKVCEDALKTAGAPVAIRLTPHVGPGGLKADGADMALVDVEVVDAKGQRCPTALNSIDFALSGPAQWRGGIAQGPNNFILSKTLPVECGVNRVIVRSAPTAGSIVLTATTAGLRSATLNLTSRAIPTNAGISLLLTDVALPSHLERGPTPSTDSVTITRIPLTVASATAGSNSDQISASYDDDETTGWSSDGLLSTGWIQYELARPTAVSEVTLKLAGWRTKSYPLRILVNDKVVYAGKTPASLGYVTFTFPPTSGSHVRLELSGSAANSDAFGSIVEVTGKKEPDAPDALPAPTTEEKAAPRGTLNIIETELYGPVAKP